MNVLRPLLVIFFILFSQSYAFSSVLYCTGERAVGFETKQNRKITTFNDIRFKVNVDFQNMTVTSEEIRYSKKKMHYECLRYESELYCINAAGDAFAINSKTLEFRLASIMVYEKGVDDLVIRYGNCEKF